jgi:hypothetical protein
LYEQRLNRTLAQAHAQLKELQQERAKAREQALNDAAQIRKLKEALGQPWIPESDGFEFSSADLAAWIERRELLEQARGAANLSRSRLSGSQSRADTQSTNPNQSKSMSLDTLSARGV